MKGSLVNFHPALSVDVDAPTFHSHCDVAEQERGDASGRRYTSNHFDLNSASAGPFERPACA